MPRKIVDLGEVNRVLSKPRTYQPTVKQAIDWMEAQGFEAGDEAVDPSNDKRYTYYYADNGKFMIQIWENPYPSEYDLMMAQLAKWRKISISQLAFKIPTEFK